MHDRDGGKFLPLDPDSLPLNGRSSGRGTAQRHSHGCPSKPYPIAAAQTKNRQYVRMIRNVYCGSGCSELNAAMQYFYHSLILRECAPQVSREILNIAICEMHHLELLGQLLCSMGSEPKFFGIPLLAARDAECLVVGKAGRNCVCRGTRPGAAG